MNASDWVSIQVDRDFVRVDPHQSFMHSNPIFSKYKPLYRTWLLDQSLYSTWTTVLRPLSDMSFSDGEAPDVWIGPREFAQEWVQRRAFDPSLSVTIEDAQKPCPMCSAIYFADDHDSVYPCNRERTRYQAGCAEHNFGCGYHVHAETMEQVISAWNRGLPSEVDLLPLVERTYPLDLPFSSEQLIEASEALRNSSDEWVRAMRLELVLENNAWMWRGICMVGRQLRYRGELWLNNYVVHHGFK